MTKEVNIFNLGKQPWDFDDQTFEVNLIENLTSEILDEFEFESQCEFELESEISDPVQTVDSPVHGVSNPITPNSEPINFIQPLTESPPHSELKDLPNHLKYIYLSENKTLLLIIASHLIEGQEESLLFVLRRHREAIGQTMADIKGLRHQLFNIVSIWLKRRHQNETPSVDWTQLCKRFSMMKL